MTPDQQNRLEAIYAGAKPETREWLDKVVPLLAWLKEGGRVQYGGMLIACNEVSWNQLVSAPQYYSIHREPREFFLNVYEDGPFFTHATYAEAKDSLVDRRSKEGIRGRTLRLVEDPTWKPEDK